MVCLRRGSGSLVPMDLRSTLFALACALTLGPWLGGCPRPETRVATTDGGVWTVEIDEASYPQGVNLVLLYVIDEASEPATGLDLTPVFTMPSMSHDAATVEVSEDPYGDGSYTVEVDLDMTGEWLLTGTLSNPLFTDEVFTLDLEVY